MKDTARIMAETGKEIGPAMKEAGFSDAYAKNPHKIVATKTWQELMEEYLPDDALAEAHQGLLHATRIDHMVFPLGPDTDEGDPSEGPPAGPEVPEAFKERTKMTDREIEELLASVNCTVRKIVHGETARHVYFWSPDNKARKEGIDLAYKLKARYAAVKVDHTFEVLDPAQKAKLDTLLGHKPEAVVAAVEVVDADVAEKKEEASTVNIEPQNPPIAPKTAENGPVETPPVQDVAEVDASSVSPVDAAELDKLLTA